jgi:predicted outer membrane protein
MRRAALLCLLLGGCGSAADQELVALKSAHSIVAEWAAVARLRADGRVTETYARAMADDARSQLASARRELKDPNDPAARLIDDLGATPDRAHLDVTASALGALEQSREDH